MARSTTKADGPARLLKIGEVAKLAGVGIEALRFYERQGLLTPSTRTETTATTSAPIAVPGSRPSAVQPTPAQSMSLRPRSATAADNGTPTTTMVAGRS